MKVGFIGLGTMGKPMATNLLKAGHLLTVWNRSPAPAHELAAAGARIAAEPARIFASSDVVISMLADDAAVEAITTDAILAGASKGLVHANMATISVAAATTQAARHRAAGLSYVSAPVFGRANLAAEAKLNIVAAGEDAAIARLQPLFDAMGQKTWRAGTEPRQATLVKITGNFMLATAIELLAEATTLAEKGGVDPRMFTEVMTSTLFAAPVFKVYSELINDRRFEPAGFKMSLGLKDVGLALAAAQSTNTPLPLASLVRDRLLEGLAGGLADHDWSALSTIARRNAGL